MSTRSQTENAKFHNWVRGTLALQNLRNGLSKYVNQHVIRLHESFKCCIKQKYDRRNPSCITCPDCKKNPNSCDSTKKQQSCANCVRKELRVMVIDEHFYSKPIWTNTDTKKWISDAWEVAKCYLGSSGYRNKQPSAIDVTGMLSICLNCKSIRSSISKISSFEEVRILCTIFRHICFIRRLFVLFCFPTKISNHLALYSC